MTNKEIIEGIGDFQKFYRMTNEGYSEDGEAGERMVAAGMWGMSDHASFLDAAISALKAGEWVEIDKIPDEWKDGRSLWFGAPLSGLLRGSVSIELAQWKFYQKYLIKNKFFTHAMLPPRLPQLPGEG